MSRVVRPVILAVLLAWCGGSTTRVPAVRIEPLPQAPPPVPVHEKPAEEHHLLTFEEAWRKAAPRDGTGSELTREELAGPMASGAVVNVCGAPSTMKVDVKVAILDGAPVGVTVRTNPEDAAIARCIDAAVRRMSWPKSPQMDAVHTVY